MHGPECQQPVYLSRTHIMSIRLRLTLTRTLPAVYHGGCLPAARSCGDALRRESHSLGFPNLDLHLEPSDRGTFSYKTINSNNCNTFANKLNGIVHDSKKVSKSEQKSS